MGSVSIAGGIAALCSVVALAGCGGSGGTGSTTTASAAKVTSFDVSKLVCGAAVTAPVNVTWTTEGATSVDIAVDDFPPAKGGPSGTKVVTVPCDGDSHQIALTPTGTGGAGETQTKDVSS